MGGKSKDVTVGYRYFMGLHFGICHGPVDALCEIRVGGRTAYSTEITGSTEIYINSPKLFGGDKREGGIQGFADVLGGTPTQGINAYLQEQHGVDARVPAYRGLFALIYKGGLVASNNPYIKPWAFKVRRIIEGWGEYSTEERSELAADVLNPWLFGAIVDPRSPDNEHEYNFAGQSYGSFAPAYVGTSPGWGSSQTEQEALDAFVTAWEAGLPSVPVGDLNLVAHIPESTSENAAGATSTQVGPYNNVLPHERVTATLHYNEIIPATYEAFAASSSDGELSHYTGIGATSGNAAYRTQCIGRNLGPWYMGSEGGVAENGSYPAFQTGRSYATEPTWFFNGVRSTVDCLVQVRRIPSAPATPGADFPDYPDDPDNYTYDPDTGTIYSKEPYAQAAGSFRWLSIYSEAGSPAEVVRYPLGPVLEQGDTSDTEAFWTAAYDAAVLAGDLPSGMTYQANGLGGITTYPRNQTYAYARTYLAIIPAEPPDAGIAQIGDDMNPAHIVRQCITNVEWGMGYPDALIGESFSTCAQTLYDEGFGLSFQWVQQEPIEDFIGQVLNHCGGVWYADPRTGKFEMALIRDDYDLSDLRTFDESNIISLDSYQKPGYGELVNEITVAFTDVQNIKTATTAPLQDPACIQAQGSVISEVRQYPGITKADLAQKVALRDLTAASTPLASIKLKVNREGWDLIPGKDCIILSWGKLGITQLVCRVLKVDRGSLEDGTVILEVAEDVFGLPSAVYTTQESEEWTDPNVEPDDISLQDLVESPYWDLARNLSAADLDYTDVDAGYVFTLGARSTPVETSYGIWSRTGSSDYEDRGTGPYAPTALLNGAIDQQTTSITLDSGVDLDLVEVGGRVLIGTGRFAEFCEVLTLNTTTGVMTVNRAVLDTTPQEHADNTRVWFVDDNFGVDQTERATSDEVDVKLTAIATGGESDPEDATEQSITMAGRFGRPYPPARVTVNGQQFPTTIDTTEDESEGFIIRWAHRDRTQQTASIVTQLEDDIGPEPGTTYTVELYNDDTDELIESASGIPDTTYSLSSTDSLNARLEVYSVRDGIESWQRQIRRFLLIGTDLLITEDGDYMLTEDGEYMAPEN